MSALSALRPFHLDDVPAALALMREALGEGRVPRSEAFFRWKHIESPFGPSFGFVVDDEDNADGRRLLALRLFQRWQLEKGGFPVLAVRAVDTATAPSAQGRGLFRTLTMAAVDAAIVDDVDLVFNTPNDRSGAGYLKMGWQRLGKPGVWMRAARPSWRGVVAGVDVDVAVVAAAARTPSGDARLRTRSSEAALRWRYVAIPGFSYRMHRVGDAVAVFRRQRRRGVAECTVCALHHPHTLRGVRDAARLIDELAKGYLGVLSVMPQTTSTTAALVAAGCAWTPLGPQLFARPLSLRRVWPMPTAVADFAFGIGDLELF
jgi:hypothetical protein